MSSGLWHVNNVPVVEIRGTGIVKEVKKGIVSVADLPNIFFGQKVLFESGIPGMVIGFNDEEAQVIAFGDDSCVSTGDKVITSEELLSVRVSNSHVGRIFNGLGEPIDAKPPIRDGQLMSVFNEAAGVMDRKPITQGIRTGIKILDLAIPIGKGQRELIIGDRQTGKSAIGIDTIINQKGKDVVCIYCWCGGSKTNFEKVMNIFRSKGVMDYSIVVAAFASCSTAEQYVAPYTAAAIGEYFMYNGKDVVVVFDDLTKHAWAYRQMSLLMQRAPGREAYPGDVFFLHSQLLERAANLNDAHGGGSMTFFPIVETLQGDITGYIPSNIVSITDGQIYMDADLFREGFKPSIDLGLSVSRIGSKVQKPAIKEVGKGIRLDYTQYRQMLRLTRLRTKLSEEAEKQMKHGHALSELLKQDVASPISMAEEIVLFYAYDSGILDDLTAIEIRQFKEGFFVFFAESYSGQVRTLDTSGMLSDEVKKLITKSAVRFVSMIKEENSE